MFIAVLGSIATDDLLRPAEQDGRAYPAGRAGAPLVSNLIKEYIFHPAMARYVFWRGWCLTAVSPYMAASVQGWTRHPHRVVPNPVVVPARQPSAHTALAKVADQYLALLAE